jgi:hypothetical protein
LVSSEVICINYPLYTHHEVIGHREEDIIGNQEYINEKKHEILPVPKTYTVVYPRAVMVHV